MFVLDAVLWKLAAENSLVPLGLRFAVEVFLFGTHANTRVYEFNDFGMRTIYSSQVATNLTMKET